jgi:hypothetical protein
MLLLQHFGQVPLVVWQLQMQFLANIILEIVVLNFVILYQLIGKKIWILYKIIQFIRQMEKYPKFKIHYLAKDMA